MPIVLRSPLLSPPFLPPPAFDRLYGPRFVLFIPFVLFVEAGAVWRPSVAEGGHL